MRTSGCSTQKQSHTTVTGSVSGKESGTPGSGSANGSANGSVNGNGDNESGSASARGTRIGRGGKRSGSASEPDEMRKTGSSVTRTRTSSNLALHSPPAAKQSHQRRKAPLWGPR